MEILTPLRPPHPQAAASSCLVTLATDKATRRAVDELPLLRRLGRMVATAETPCELTHAAAALVAVADGAGWQAKVLARAPNTGALVTRDSHNPGRPPAQPP